MKPKYTPDVATVLRETDPRKRKAERQRAREDAQRPTPPGFFARYDAEDDGGADPARVSAPSPWANGATFGLDKAALPSAMGPAGVEKATEEEAPRTPAAPAAAARRRIEGKHVAVAVALGLVVAAVAIVMPMLTRRSPRAPAPDEAPVQHAVSPPAPTQRATAATPSVTAAAEPTATASATATAEPKTPALRPKKPRGGGDDPYEGTAVPSSPKTAAPVSPPAPPATLEPATPPVPSHPTTQKPEAID